MQPMMGHFHSVVSLARALQVHGHEVAFATGKSFGPVVQRAGFQHFPCGIDFDGSIDTLEAMPQWQAIKKQIPPGPVQQLTGFAQVLAPVMADDLLGLVKNWPPQVIIRDPVEFGGYIAAEYWGVPHATIMWAL